MHKNILILLVSIFLLCTTICAEEDPMYDPWENVNRGIFAFNDTLDRYLAEPIAESYDYIMPSIAQDWVGNFFENLSYPQFLVSDLIQFKFLQALEHSGRFLINTTMGVGGIFDVAKSFGLPEHKEDFGIALAKHGVGSGPYMVLPFLGPSNLRDTVGTVVDGFLNPIYWLTQADTIIDENDAFTISYATTALNLINKRAGLLEAIDAAKESSLDYYFFVQSAYYQNRQGILYDGNPPTAENEDIFEEDDPFADEYN